MSNERRDVSPDAGGRRLPRAGQTRGMGLGDGDRTGVLPVAFAALGPYRLIEQVGEGGMGVVHKAVDRDGREVAIKVLRSHIAHDSGARERLRREVSTLRRVRSDAVAEVLDADVEGDRPYLVTRFVPGAPLDAVVEDEGPFDAVRLVRLGQGLAKALRAIHAAGVVHRDVKPGNVLMNGDDPVLIDFGIAHVADDIRLTMTGLVMGTPGYLSPEIVEGAPVGEATDWWGWAATLAFAASGQAPFGRGPMHAVLDRVTRGAPDLSGVDDRIRPLLTAALSPHPEDRPDAGEVLRQLAVYAAGGHTGSLPVRPPTEHLPSGAPASTVPRDPYTAPYPQDPYAAPTSPYPAYPQDPYAVPPGRHPAQTGPGPYADGTGHPAAARHDPRIGQPARTWTLVAFAAAVVGISGLWPLAGLSLLVLWSFAARWADKAMTSLVLRRFGAGPRRTDGLVAVLASPWHGLLAACSTVFTALIPAFVGLCTSVVVALGFAMAGGGVIEPNRPVPLAAGVLVVCWMLWWGPGGSSMRRGSRSIVRGVVRGEQLTRVICALLVVIAAGAALWSLGHLDTTASWWPYDVSSQFPLHSWLPSLPGR